MNIDDITEVDIDRAIDRDPLQLAQWLREALKKIEKLEGEARKFRVPCVPPLHDPYAP